MLDIPTKTFEARLTHFVNDLCGFAKKTICSAALWLRPAGGDKRQGLLRNDGNGHVGNSMP